MQVRMSETQLKAKTVELRKSMLTMLNAAGSGHTGGALSSIDIMAVLYHNILNHDPANHTMKERDRFYLSKGHVCPALYAVLADFGYFDKGELMNLRKYGCILQGHPCMLHTPGVEVSAGSLGQGLSIAAGTAIGAKLNKELHRVYCLMGDGELQEGQIWEAAMTAGHYKLDNLCGIVDFNGLQIDGKVEDVMNINPLREKWEAFNWNVIETDGHNLVKVEEAFKQAAELKGKPTVIIAHTVKGKGISFMENSAGWHGVAPNNEQLAMALAELDA